MSRSLKLLAAIFAASGMSHLVRPQTFEPMVPKPLPYKRRLVYVSGAAEIACAGLLAGERTRRSGAICATVLLVAVFPANIQMTVSALGNRRAPTWFKAATLARLPLQYPLIRTAIRAAEVTSMHNGRSKR